MTRTLGLAVVALAVLAPAAHAAKRCSQLKGRDLAPAKHVKLVKHANADDGTDLLGCILPRGKVRRFASSEDLYTTQNTYRLRQVSREKILLDSATSSQYGSGSSTSVVDIRTGDSYGIASQCYMLGGGECSPGAVNVTATAARINDIGQAVAFLATGGRLEVTGFSSHGFRYKIDSGTADEITNLKLDHSVASWRHSGELMTFALDG